MIFVTYGLCFGIPIMTTQFKAKLEECSQDIEYPLVILSNPVAEILQSKTITAETVIIVCLHWLAFTYENGLSQKSVILFIFRTSVYFHHFELFFG